MRLIDADELKALYDDAEFVGEKWHVPIRVILANIDDMSTIDAVEVVRCKDCKWGRETCGNIECNVDLNVPSEYHSYDWFCPNGERTR